MIAIEIVAHYAVGMVQGGLAIKQPQHGRNENVQRRTKAKAERQKVAREKFPNFCHI